MSVYVYICFECSYTYNAESINGTLRVLVQLAAVNTLKSAHTEPATVKCMG